MPDAPVPRMMMSTAFMAGISAQPGRGGNPSFWQGAFPPALPYSSLRAAKRRGNHRASRTGLWNASLRSQ